MESNLEDYEVEVREAYEQMVWASYESLEDAFIDFLSYVPMTHKHKEVWSPKLANLIVNIGSTIDSTFKSYLESPTLDTAKDIDKIRSDQRKQTIYAFQKVYDAGYSFSNREVYLLAPAEKLMPWSNWQKQDTPPIWWTAYNKVKHDRFKNITKANLENTLNALSGLFLVCVILKEIRPYLVDIGIIKTQRIGAHTGDLKQLLEENEPIPDAFNPIIARSKLFGYIFRSTGEYENWGFRIFS